jgi:hypothetical protein
MTSLPLTPPPELVQQWASMSPKNDAVQQNWIEIATQAAQWGADQELEACCLWMERNFDDWDNRFSDDLRRHRRPRPPSLKEQALKALDTEGYDLSVTAASVIRRALEQLDD